MECVEQRNGGLYVAGTRVSLDSVVYAHLRGESPEAIVNSFPTLSLNQVRRSIEYYLSHRSDVDAYLERQENAFDCLAQEARQQDAEFYAKIDAARKDLLTRRG